MKICHHSFNKNTDHCTQKVSLKFWGIKTTSLFHKFFSLFKLKKHKTYLFFCSCHGDLADGKINDPQSTEIKSGNGSKISG